MFKQFIKKVVLNKFFEIELTSGEQIAAEKSVKDKYTKALKKTFFYLSLAIFPVLFLETSVIISVLIPITMVAGTAWFSISLANMKQKFESFGLTLTANLFEAFSISLGLLFMLSVFSLSSVFWQETIRALPYQELLRIIAVIFSVIIIGNIVYKIFIGSIKYDINDAMLTGQNEIAERFYRKSLSLLHSVSNTLKDKKSLQVANYYIGVAFFEIFSYLKDIGIKNEKLNGLIQESNVLVKNPAMSQEKADAISLRLVNTFILYCKNPQGNESLKSLEAISDELWCLNNNNEAQEMVDTRFAIIFQEIASLFERQGETLFL
jgi:hypothetical protein